MILTAHWDAALMSVLPRYYKQDATPQTLYRIKKDLLKVMREQHHLEISSADARRVRVEWMAEEGSVNLRLPPNLLARTLH